MATKNQVLPQGLEAQHGQSGVRASAEERLAGVRNKLRRYSAASIIEVALSKLAVGGTQVERLQERPWLVLLLVKMALQDRMVHIGIGPRIAPQLFDRLNDELWDMTSPQSVGDRFTSIYATMRAQIHAQLVFQRRESWNFLRWPALIARLQSDHPTRRQFQQELGIEPETFIDLSFALYSAVVGNEFPLRAEWFDPLRARYGNSVDQILTLFVRDVHQLRAELSADETRKLRGRGEVFEFPYLIRYPLFRQRDSRIVCWHPLVFARGMENASHLRLTGLGEKYTRPFSRVFEAYVVEILREASLTVIEEQEIKTAAGDDAPAVEAVVEGHGANVLVEAKMGLFAEEVMVEDDGERLYHKTTRIRDAIKQGWKVGKLLRSGAVSLGTTSNATEDFLLVVTSRELNIGTASHLRRMLPHGRLDYPDDNASKWLPLENVFIVSIEDFEQLCGGIAAGDIQLVPLLREAVATNQDPSVAKWFFNQHLVDKVSHRVAPRLIAEARLAAELRLRKALS